MQFQQLTCLFARHITVSLSSFALRLRVLRLCYDMINKNRLHRKSNIYIITRRLAQYHTYRFFVTHESSMFQLLFREKGLREGCRIFTETLHFTIRSNSFTR